MNKVISFANHKGGVGKTTSVASIGAALARKGKRVLLIDLDSQQNLTISFLKDEEVEVSIYEALTGKTKELPIIKIKPNLDITPSGLGMARVEIDLSSKMARERILYKLIQPIREKYDYILIDCPPSLGIVTTNALTASTDLFIPLTAEALPLKGMKMLDEFVEEIASSINPDLKVGGIFITRYNNRHLNDVVINAILKIYKDRLFSTKIRENIALAETPLTGKDIYEYDSESNGAKDYARLTEEILSRE